MVDTQTNIATKTYVMTAVTVLALAGAAYAAMGLLGGQRGYQKMYVQCHDGATIEQSAMSTRVTVPGQAPIMQPGAPCQTARHLSRKAEDFCAGRANPNSGKSGVNSYSVSQRCIVQENPSYGYGYGYGYGYNQAAASNVPAKTENTKKKSSKFLKFWKK